MKTITDHLLANRDEKNAAFVAKLIPNIPADTILGWRTPALRKYAKQLSGTPQAQALMTTLPHHYIEENTLHAFLIAQIKDFTSCIRQTELFLPYIDNWAVCDQFSPTCFAKHKQELLPYINCWLQGHLLNPANNTLTSQSLIETPSNTDPSAYLTHHDTTDSTSESFIEKLSNIDKGAYITRYGIGMLLRHFLDDDFREEQMQIVANIKTDHYYVMMMQAWYFATALAKQYPTALQYLPSLQPKTLTKTIQKACESSRISPKQKEYLKKLPKRS